MMLGWNLVPISKILGGGVKLEETVRKMGTVC